MHAYKHNIRFGDQKHHMCWELMLQQIMNTSNHASDNVQEKIMINHNHRKRKKKRGKKSVIRMCVCTYVRT